MAELDPTMARITTGRCSREICQALKHLTSGGVVVLPTDTLYGLAADVFNPAAVRRIFTIKGRAADSALPVLVSDWGMVAMVAGNRSRMARQLAETYWPGALTLVLPKRSGLSDLVTGGKDTVAVRSPNHRVPLELTGRLGRPLSGTSANRSGGPDLHTLEDIRIELGNSVDYIISGGPAPVGTPSTIVEVTAGGPKLIREGTIPFQEILKAC
jgi:L-threonylcarbamoyladenylate synthase